MFAVDDIDDTLDRLVKHGAQLVSNDVVQCGPRSGSATSAGLKAFSSGSPKNSAEPGLAAATQPTATAYYTDDLSGIPVSSARGREHVGMNQFPCLIRTSTAGGGVKRRPAGGASGAVLGRAMPSGL